MEQIIDTGKEVIVIKNAQYIEEFKVFLVFSNGVTKVVDLKDYLQSKKPCGILEPLKDVEYFKTLYYNENTETIEWNNGADLAPEFLYELGQDEAAIPLELEIDRELFNWFLEQAKGRDYKTLMIEALESFRKIER